MLAPWACSRIMVPTDATAPITEATSTTEGRRRHANRAATTSGHTRYTCSSMARLHV
jgi:hypothetical protein